MGSQQVDRITGLGGDVAIKAPCRVATTAAITLSGFQTIDSVTVVEGDRVLVKNQADATTNGIYLAHTGAWDRALDFDGPRDCVAGTSVYVLFGTQIGFWIASPSDNPALIGTSTIGFAFLTIPFADDGFVQPEQYGAVGDGVTNDFAALQACITANRAVRLGPKTYLFNGTLSVAIDNTKIVGSGPITKIKGDNVIKFSLLASNLQLSDFSFIGDGSEVIAVGKTVTASHVTIERVNFVPTVANHLDRCVSLYNCNNVRIDKCNFISTGYGVIHEASAYTVNNLKVTHCYFSDMYGDAVLLNGGGGVATDVIIDGNSFMGSNNWTVPTAERRFVGVTSINSVKITNNFVQNCAGDAAVHLEDIGGRVTITGNHFIDCGTYLQPAYIYILHSNKSVIITNNWFVRTSASAGSEFIGTSSGAYSNEMLIEGNDFKDTSGHIAFAVDLTGHIGQALVTGNYCVGCDTFVNVTSASSVQVRGNTVESTSNGIKGNNANDIEIIENMFACSPNSITTSTGARWSVKNNRFASGDVGGTNMTDVWMMGNSFANGVATRSMALGAPTNVLQVNWNFRDGVGLF